MMYLYGLVHIFMSTHYKPMTSLPGYTTLINLLSDVKFNKIDRSDKIYKIVVNKTEEYINNINIHELYIKYLLMKFPGDRYITKPKLNTFTK